MTSSHTLRVVCPDCSFQTASLITLKAPVLPVSMEWGGVELSYPRCVYICMAHNSDMKEVVMTAGRSRIGNMRYDKIYEKRYIKAMLSDGPQRRKRPPTREEYLEMVKAHFWPNAEQDIEEGNGDAEN